MEPPAEGGSAGWCSARAGGGGRAAARAHPLGQYWDGRAPQEVPSPPPPQTKGTVVGNNEMCRWENPIGPFLVHTLFWVPDPPPPPPPPFYYYYSPGLWAVSSGAPRAPASPPMSVSDCFGGCVDTKILHQRTGNGNRCDERPLQTRQ